MSERIPYNKPENVSNQHQMTGKTPKIVQAPDINKEIEKFILSKCDGSVDVSVMEKAIQMIRKDEQKKYESGLNSLNDQLNAAKIKIGIMEEEIKGKDTTISALKQSNTETKGKEKLNEFKVKIVKHVKKLKSDSEQKDKEINRLNLITKQKEEEINELYKLLEQKDKEIINISNKSNSNVNNMNELKASIEKMFSKIEKLGIVSIDEVKNRPEIKDKIFINPVDDENSLESHINIKADDSTAGVKRNIRDEMTKLKKLINKDN